jgi:PA14 domain-containing protein
MKHKYPALSGAILLMLTCASQAQTFTGIDLGSPGYPGSAVDNGGGSLTVSGSGDDIWNAADNCYYYYTWATGTVWVATVQISDLSGPDNWSKGELMVRLSDPNTGPQANDPFIAAMSTRTNNSTVTGQNEIADQFRSQRGGGADWVELNPVWHPTYPNQWLRLSRTNNSITVAFSSDGLNFTNYLTIDTASTALVSGSTFGTPWPNVLSVGLAVTAHNNTSTTLGMATFQNLSLTFPPVTLTAIGASTQVQNVSAYPGSEASFTFVTTNNANPPAISWPIELGYQWYKNGTAIPNATSTSYTRLVNPSDATENGSQYYCQATVLPPYNTTVAVTSLTSATGTVTVLPGAVYYTNGLKQEFFANAGRTDVENGNMPAANSLTVTTPLDSPGNLGGNYVTRHTGWFIPPTTDNYTFFLACDDDSDFFVSTNGANPANKVMVAQEQGWSPYRAWLTVGAGNPAQKRSDGFSPDGGATVPFATGIPLTAGTPYYVELVHHQGGGGDNFSVTYQTATQMADPNWANVFTNGVASLMNSGLVLITTPTTTLSFSLQPTNTSISQGLSATIYSRASTDSELTPKYQWYRNGALVPGATSSAISSGITTPANNGDTFYVVATTAEAGFSITSSVVTLQVVSAVFERGWATVEFWNGGNRGAIENGSAGAPTYTTTSPGFEASLNGETGNGYGRRISGYFIPPATDDYVFFVNSDDDSDLWVSTNNLPSGKRLVAQETSWANPLLWAGDHGNLSPVMPQKRSDSWSPDNGATMPYSTGIHLIGGQQYYMEIDHSEGGGGDNVEATYKRVSDNDPWNGMDTKFRGNVLGTFAPRCSFVAFTTQPTNKTVAPSLSGSVSFVAVGTSDSTVPVGITGDVRPLVGNWPKVMYQWQKNGTDIPGATSSTLSLNGPILPSDSGAQFLCRIRALGYADNSLNPIWSNSAPATLTVTPNIPLTYEPGIVLVEDFEGKSRAQIETGTVGSPNWVSTTPAYEVSINNGSGDNYSRRLASYFIPPTTDDYIFWINVDDDADLFLSTDASPLGKRLIAHQEGASGTFAWNNLNNNQLNVNKRSDLFTDAATGLNNNFTGIHLTGGQRYYLEAVYHEGGGGDNFEATYSTVTGAPPNDGDDTRLKGNVVGIMAPVSHVAITNQPVSQTTPSYTPVTFTVGGSTDSQISVGTTGDIRNSLNTYLMYQWYKNGTAIAGGTGSALTLSNPLPSDNGSTIYCQVRSIGLGDGAGNAVWSNSQPATLSVTTNTPHLLYSAVYTNDNYMAFGGPETIFVTLSFDTPMDPVLLSQPSTYTLGSGLTITGITINSNDYRSVMLAVTGTPTFPFSITINGNVSGFGGGAHVANTTVPVGAVPLVNVDIGSPGADPAVPGILVADGPSAYTIMCEGSDIWSPADGFNFSYEVKTNDFDVVVRQLDTRHTSNWAKGGLMLRESLDPTSRNWNIVNDPLSGDGIMAPDNSGFGANAVECNARNGNALASGGWAFAGGVPAYPNAWVRLTRRGQELAAYRSTDGQHWTLLATNNPTLVGDMTPLPANLYVGICATAHNNDPVGTPSDQLRFLLEAHFANYNSSYIPPSVLTVTQSGSNVTISWNPNVGHLESTPTLGAGINWQPVPGGTTSPAILPIGSGSLFFRVVNP